MAMRMFANETAVQRPELAKMAMEHGRVIPERGRKIGDTILKGYKPTGSFCLSEVEEPVNPPSAEELEMTIFDMTLDTPVTNTQP